MKRRISLLALCLLGLASCQTTTTVLDVDKPKYYGKDYAYSDLKAVTEKMISSIVSNPPIVNRNDRPVMLVAVINNRTDEHIDTNAIAEKIITGLTQTHKVRFVNAAARDKIANEIGYQSGGMVAPETRVKMGKQVGADYVITGAITSILSEEGRGARLKERSIRYFKVNLEMTDINTNIVEWSEEHEFAREESKPFIGW
jgi:hypothetical protein